MDDPYKRRRLIIYEGSREGQDNQSEIMATVGLLAELGRAYSFRGDSLTSWAGVHRSRPHDLQSAIEWSAIISL
jgi:hypothetical protein